MRNEYLGLTEAAKAIGISRPTLTRLVRAGELPAYRDRLDQRRTLLAVADLEALRRPLPKATPPVAREVAA